MLWKRPQLSTRGVALQSALGPPSAQRRHFPGSYTTSRDASAEFDAASAVTQLVMASQYLVWTGGIWR